MALFNLDLNKAREALQNVAKSVEQAAKDVKIPEVHIDLEQMKNMATEAADSLKKSVARAPEVIGEQKPEFPFLSPKNALKIFYYVMAADGEIFHGEEDKFDDMGREVDADFEKDREAIISECEAQLARGIDPEDHFECIQDGIEEALMAACPPEERKISAKWLIWNMLALAYSDERYDERERKLLKYVVRKTNTDKTVFLEMESSFLTLLDVDRELAWVKTINRPYLTIEATVQELINRKDVIVKSVNDLIML